MKYNMSKTAALKLAQRAVGDIHRCSSSSYVFYAPYYNDAPDGPINEIQRCTYWQTLDLRKRRVASLALSQMVDGLDNYPMDRLSMVYAKIEYADGDARQILDAAIATLESEMSGL